MTDSQAEIEKETDGKRIETEREREGEIKRKIEKDKKEGV